MNHGLLVLLLALLGVCASRADDWLRADVYFIEWDVETRVALTPQRVRKIAQFKRTFRNDAPAVARLLELGKFKRPTKNGDSEDARLVIDLTDDTFQRHTFYASYFSLCSSDSARKRPIDQRFRQRVSSLAKGEKLK